MVITFVLVASGFAVIFIVLEETVLTITRSGITSSPYIQQYDLPDKFMPNAILVDKQGTIWIAGSHSQLAEFHRPESGTSESSTFSVHQLPSYETNDTKSPDTPVMVWSMVQDTIGNIWISQQGKKVIFVFDPTTEEFTSMGPVSSAPFQMKLNEDSGNIWYTSLEENKIGVIQKTSTNQINQNHITEFDIGYNASPSGIYAEEDKLWITQLFDNKIVTYSIERTQSGSVTGIKKQQEVPATSYGPFVSIPASPTDIIVRDDRNIWVTEHGTSFFANHDIEEETWIRYPTSPIEFEATSLPFWLRMSENGFWFNEHTGNKIGFFDTSEMSLTEYTVPGRLGEDFVIQLLNISADPKINNSVWFTAWNLDKIGYIDGAIPLSFDIRIKTDQIIIDPKENVTKEVEIEVFGIKDNQSKDLQLMSSSTLGISGGFVNMTAGFSDKTISSDKIENKTIRLSLSDYSNAPSGNYMIGVSLTDSSVTKTDFVELIIK